MPKLSIESERKRAFRKKYSSYKEQLKGGLENKEMRAMPTVFRKVEDANPSFAQKTESLHSDVCDGSSGVCDVHEENNFSAKAVGGLYLMIFNNINIILANIYHN